MNKDSSTKKIPKVMLDFIPFEDVWNNYVYLDNERIVGGIKVGSINLGLLFDEERDIKVRELKKVLNSIDYSIKIFSIDKPILLDENINILNTKIKQEDNKAKIKILEEDLDYINFLNNKRRVVNREFYIIVEESSDNENLLKQKLNNLVVDFSAMGLSSSIVSSEEWRDLIYVILNPVVSLDSFKKDATGITRSFKEKVAPRGLKIGEKDLILGDAYMSIVTLITYPSYVDVGWLGEVANVNNTRMVITISPMDTAEISRTLKKSMSDTKSKMINVSDYNDQIILHNQMDDYAELVNRIDREHEKFTKLTVCFLVYGATKEDMERSLKELKDTLSAYGLYGTNLMFEQERGLKMCLPTMYTDLEKQFGIDVPMLSMASAFPFIFQNLQDDGDSLILGNDGLGSLVFFDLWKRTNKRNNSNAVIIGKSGSGKSTLLKKIVRGNWARGTKIIAIDPERELKEMCESVGGTWIDAGTGLSGIINPLEVRKTADESDDEKKLSSTDLNKHFQTFRTFIKYYLQDVSAYELTKIEDALIQVYKDKGITFSTDISKLKSTDYPIMEDLYKKLLENLKEAKLNREPRNVVESLEKICSLMKKVVTTDAKILNGHSSININNKSDFIVLDINSLIDSDECILKSQFFNILTWCWNEICRDKSEQVILLCDEAHLIIDPNNHQGIDFLKKASKLIRKRNGSLCIASQNLIDFTAPEIARYGQVIIDNSSYIMVMAQGQKEIGAVQQLMNLSESEKNFLTTASKGEGLFIISHDTRLPLNVHLRDEEKELFGTAGGK